MKPPLITTKAKFNEILQQALGRAKALAQEVPDDPFQKSILHQLQFMAQFLTEGRVPTYEERQKINVGVIAMRTFDDSDPTYAEQLSELDYAFNRWESLR